MADRRWPNGIMSSQGPKHVYSAAAAAEILNLHFDPSQPKEVLFDRVMGTILRAMNAADTELGRGMPRPSIN